MTVATVAGLHGCRLVWHHASSMGHHGARGTVTICHDGVGRLTGAAHHGLGRAILKAAEIEMHIVGHMADVGDVQELVELIVRGRGHMMVLAIPASSTHQGGDGPGVA
jgi:hypothetical protein